jgi:hypothetical protein
MQGLPEGESLVTIVLGIGIGSSVEGSQSRSHIPALDGGDQVMVQTDLPCLPIGQTDREAHQTYQQ